MSPRRLPSDRLRALTSPVARTARLMLVFPDRRYRDEVVALLNDPEVARFTLRIPYPYRAADAAQFYRGWRRRWRTGTGVSLQLVRTADGALIGGLGLHRIDDEHRLAEVGYWIGRPYRRQGYGAEAVDALVRVVFGRLGLNRIEAHVFVENTGSHRLLRRLGFRREGRLRQAFRKDGTARDAILYARLKGDPPPR